MSETETSGFEKPAVVLDNGSHLIKAGFSCDNHPVAMFRSIVGRPKGIVGRFGRAGHYDVFIGEEQIAREDYNFKSPVVRGQIVDWDNMERVWHHVFYRELKVAPEDRAVMIACAPDLPMASKIRTAQIFFEALNVPAICIQPQNVLALYGSGHTTGITVDLGYDSVTVNPVYEGGSIKYARVETGYAGIQVCQFFKNSLEQRGIDIGVGNAELIDDMMQTMYVTNDVVMSRKGYERPFELPSGKTIDLHDEAFLAAEIFFQPELIQADAEVMSLQDAVESSSKKCDLDLQGELHAAIVTAGGFSMIPGLNSRLKHELDLSLGQGVTVLTSTESNVVSWMGAAIFAGIPEARRMWITKKQFDDYGEKIIKNRFM